MRFRNRPLPSPVHGARREVEVFAWWPTLVRDEHDHAWWVWLEKYDRVDEFRSVAERHIRHAGIFKPGWVTIRRELYHPPLHY